MLENPSEAEGEYDRYKQRRFVIELDDNLVTRRFGRGHLNKLGLIIQVKRDGRRKLRLIVDVRRSRANARAAVAERPILPRATDPALDAADGIRRNVDMEFAGADFSDAYCHVMIHHDELRNNLIARPPSAPARRIGRVHFVPRRRRPQVGLMVRLGFGSRAGLLIWSRFSAACGRMGQSALRPCGETGLRSKLQIYLDDPIFTLFGRRRLRGVLLLWATCGFRIAWARGERGSAMNWIAVDYEHNTTKRCITLRVPRKAIDEVVSITKTLLDRPLVPIKALRKLAARDLGYSR